MKLKALVLIAGLALTTSLVSVPATASETLQATTVTASSPEPVTASPDVVLSSEEPAVSTEPAPQPEPSPEPVQEPVVTPQPTENPVAPEPQPEVPAPAEQTPEPAPAPVEPEPAPVALPDGDEARALFDSRLAYHLSPTEQDAIFAASYLGYVTLDETPQAYTVVVQSVINPGYRYVFDLKPYDCAPEDAPEGTEWAKCFEHDLKIS